MHAQVHTHTPARAHTERWSSTTIAGRPQTRSRSRASSRAWMRCLGTWWRRWTRQW